MLSIVVSDTKRWVKYVKESKRHACYSSRVIKCSHKILASVHLHEDAELSEKWFVCGFNPALPPPPLSTQCYLGYAYACSLILKTPP